MRIPRGPWQPFLSECGPLRWWQGAFRCLLPVILDINTNLSDCRTHTTVWRHIPGDWPHWGLWGMLLPVEIGGLSLRTWRNRAIC